MKEPSYMSTCLKVVYGGGLYLFLLVLILIYLDVSMRWSLCIFAPAILWVSVLLSCKVYI